jgi:hypothetical protein
MFYFLFCLYFFYFVVSFSASSLYFCPLLSWFNLLLLLRFMMPPPPSYLNYVRGVGVHLHCSYYTFNFFQPLSETIFEQRSHSIKESSEGIEKCQNQNKESLRIIKIELLFHHPALIVKIALDFRYCAIEPAG